MEHTSARSACQPLHGRQNFPFHHQSCKNHWAVLVFRSVFFSYVSSVVFVNIVWLPVVEILNLLFYQSSSRLPIKALTSRVIFIIGSRCKINRLNTRSRSEHSFWFNRQTSFVKRSTYLRPMFPPGINTVCLGGSHSQSICSPIQFLELS